MRTAAVILAAGRGSRLAPLAEEFAKPLHPVDGLPLIGHAIRFAEEFGVDEIVVVASPRNRQALDLELTGVSGLGFVEQREPTGVVDAIAIGAGEVDCAWNVLLLCCDNTFHPDGRWFRGSVVDEERPAIAVRAATDPRGRLTTWAEGGLEPRAPDSTIRYRWVGPVLCNALELHVAALGRGTVEEVLNRLGRLAPIEMSCEDRGVAER